MNMGLVSSTHRHTALDPDVVYHEYTHGLTNRLVGGPMNDTALDAEQSAGMGEGWSDYIACTLLGKTTVGEWVVDNNIGIRSHPYDESFPNDYSDLGVGDFTEVHSIGELWCATLMALGRRIGPWVAAQIVVDGLKLTSANPSFLAARDAILLAAAHVSTARGDTPDQQAAFVGEVWATFARFGMGPAAQTNGATLTGIVADFTNPAGPTAATVFASASPALAIPDANAAGVRSSINLATHGAVTALTVSVDITHTYRGDLRVSLIAPDGRAAVLHDRAGGGVDDLRTAYTSDAVASLAALLGQPAAGAWTLAVVDLARADTGRVNSWSIEATLGDDVETIELEATPGVVVPDNQPAGITSTLTVDGHGPVRVVELDVDITHTFIGDLEVAVRAPSGERVVLHRRKRGGEDNLIATFTSAAAGVLAPLIGIEVHGDWTLQVADKAARDVGKLNRWVLRISV